MRTRLAAVLGALVLAASACGGGGDGGEDSSSTDDSSEIQTEAPEQESTEGTEEAEQGGNNAVAVELPGLPVGGQSTVVSETLQCAEVSWSGPPDLPEGWGIAVRELTFDPSSDFAESGEPCPLDTPPCTASGVLVTSSGGCHVAVTWTQPNLDGGQLGFGAGTLACPPGQEAVCAEFEDEVETDGPQTIDLQPSPEPEESEGSGEESSPDEGSGEESSPDEGTGESTEPGSEGGDPGTGDDGG
jgi:hypothetical protein